MDGWTYTALDIVVERGLFGHGLWVMERSWWSGEESGGCVFPREESWVDQEC